jgi:predicted RNA-binding protein with PIN domain
MSVHFTVDAYNVIRHKSYRPKVRTNDPRRTLLAHIREERLCGSAKNRITVVFDGFSDGFTYDDTSFTVLFSGEGTADERIKRIIAAEANPRALVIVSDDREIRDYAKIHGVGSVSVDNFLLKDIRRRVRAAKDDDSAKPGISSVNIDRINRELRSRWLK